MTKSENRNLTSKPDYRERPVDSSWFGLRVSDFLRISAFGLRLFLLAVRPGFEPGQRPPKGLVLPLHHRTDRQKPNLQRSKRKQKVNLVATGRFVSALQIRTSLQGFWRL